MQIFLISGLSGSGKSVALKTLEDSGFYCVDNLPSELLSTLIEQLMPTGHQNIAVSVDVRNSSSVHMLPYLLLELMQKDLAVHVLFLEAQTETLVKRFSETRRMHPLNVEASSLSSGKQGRTLLECVQQERELLSEISSIGHRIDTTELSANALRNWVKQFIKIDRSRLTLLFQSFGYKRGIPMNADLVFDVRCIPNPYYNPLLRQLTGIDAEVSEFLDNTPVMQEMYGDICSFVERWLPHFVEDNRSYLTVAIGCTGGQHRSVYLSEKLARHFDNQYQVLVRHRELA